MLYFLVFGQVNATSDYMNMEGEEFYNLMRSNLSKGVLSSFLEAFEKTEKNFIPIFPLTDYEAVSSTGKMKFRIKEQLFWM